MTAAANRSVAGTPTTGPITISMTDGGIRMPSVPPAVIDARGQADVVAAAFHRRCRHHAEQGHRRADDARGCGEDRRRDQHREVERAAQRREQQLHAAEQPLHQSRLLEQVAHEQEERDRRERRVAHHAEELQLIRYSDRSPSAT